MVSSTHSTRMKLHDHVWKRGKWVANDAGDNLILQATGPDGQLEDLKYL